MAFITVLGNRSGLKPSGPLRRNPRQTPRSSAGRHTRSRPQARLAEHCRRRPAQPRLPPGDRPGRSSDSGDSSAALPRSLAEYAAGTSAPRQDDRPSVEKLVNGWDRRSVRLEHLGHQRIAPHPKRTDAANARNHRPIGRQSTIELPSHLRTQKNQTHILPTKAKGIGHGTVQRSRAVPHGECSRKG